MRGLLPIFYPISHQVDIPWSIYTIILSPTNPTPYPSKLREILINEVRSGREIVDVMKWLSRAALEYIGQGGLGYSFDAFEGKGNNYSDTMKQLVQVVIYGICIFEIN